MQSQDTLFDVRGVAEYLGVSKKWIYEHTCRKTIPHFKICGSLRFRKSDIDDWLEKSRVRVIDEWRE